MFSLLHVYIFAFVFGGVLLVASIVMGGGKAPGMDAALDTDGGADSSTDADHGHGSLGGALSSLLSLRFWMFFFAFFGATGWVLSTFEFELGRWTTFGLSLAMGAVTGYVAAAVLRALSQSGSGEIVTEAAYIGQTGRVLLPIGTALVGKIRLQLGGTTVDVLARTDEPHPFASGDTALVIQMDGTTAVVARLETPRS